MFWTYFLSGVAPEKSSCPLFLLSNVRTGEWSRKKKEGESSSLISCTVSRKSRFRLIQTGIPINEYQGSSTHKPSLTVDTGNKLKV